MGDTPPSAPPHPNVAAATINAGSSAHPPFNLLDRSRIEITELLPSPRRAPPRSSASS